jgi:hypothetical protein
MPARNRLFIVLFLTATGIALCETHAHAQRMQSGVAAAMGARMEQEADWNVARKLSLRKGIDPKRMPFPRMECEDTSIDEMEVGEVGKMRYWNFKVLSIVDADNCLLLLGTKVYWLTGYPTDSLSDGQAVRLADPVQLQEPRKYESAIGAVKTVRCLKMLAPEESDKWEAEHKKRRSLGPGYEEYQLADGTTFLGKYLESKNGAIFADDTGKKVRRKLEDFSEESQNKIREQMKAKRRK